MTLSKPQLKHVPLNLKKKFKVHAKLQKFQFLMSKKNICIDDALRKNLEIRIKKHNFFKKFKHFFLLI